MALPLTLREAGWRRLPEAAQPEAGEATYAVAEASTRARESWGVASRGGPGFPAAGGRIPGGCMALESAGWDGEGSPGPSSHARLVAHPGRARPARVVRLRCRQGRRQQSGGRGAARAAVRVCRGDRRRLGVVAWHRPRIPVVRLVLGGLAGPNATSKPWGLLLFPVAIMAWALFLPGIWFSNDFSGVGWTVALLIGVGLVVRQAPDRAARLATAGLGVLGIIGLWAAEQADALRWHPLPSMPNGSLIYGAVVMPGPRMAFVAAAEAVGFIALSVWLVPRTMPETWRLLRRMPDAELTSRVQRLAQSRAVAVDTAAADLRRLERDLHDGAQARLVALGMSLRAAERLIPTSPDAALALVTEARETSARALTELRELVRGVHPPVLADRGLADAVLALRSTVR